MKNRTMDETVTQMSITWLHFRYVKILQQLLNIVAKLDSSHGVPARIDHAVGGSLKFADAYSMAMVLAHFKPRTLLEVGSFIGMSTRWQCEIMERIHGKDTPWHITALDPNMRHRIFDNPRDVVETITRNFMPEHLEVISAFFGHLPYSFHWYQCEDANPKLDNKAVDALLAHVPRLTEDWEKRFDCIFIDANHSYESIHENFAHAVRLLNPRGTILFHDALTWEGVYKALKEIKEEWKDRASLEVIDSVEIFKHPALKQSKESRACDGLAVFALH